LPEEEGGKQACCNPSDRLLHVVLDLFTAGMHVRVENITLIKKDKRNLSFLSKKKQHSTDKILSHPSLVYRTVAARIQAHLRLGKRGDGFPQATPPR